MSIFRLQFLKEVKNLFTKDEICKREPIVQGSIRRVAFSLGECYTRNHNYNTWQYFLQSVCKPMLVRPFFKYCKNHRAELFISSRTPKAMKWE